MALELIDVEDRNAANQVSNRIELVLFNKLKQSDHHNWSLLLFSIHLISILVVSLWLVFIEDIEI